MSKINQYCICFLLDFSNYKALSLKHLVITSSRSWMLDFTYIATSWRI